MHATLLLHLSEEVIARILYLYRFNGEETSLHVERVKRRGDNSAERTEDPWSATFASSTLTVSRSFNRIGLPILWRSITITKQSNLEKIVRLAERGVASGAQLGIYTQRLELRMHAPHYNPALLRDLLPLMPNLQVFLLWNEAPRAWQDIQEWHNKYPSYPLYDALLQNCPSLTRIQLDSIEEGPDLDDILALLQCKRSLQTLRIAKMLEPISSAPFPLPKLQHLELPMTTLSFSVDERHPRNPIYLRGLDQLFSILSEHELLPHLAALEQFALSRLPRTPSGTPRPRKHEEAGEPMLTIIPTELTTKILRTLVAGDKPQSPGGGRVKLSSLSNGRSDLGLNVARVCQFLHTVSMPLLWEHLQVHSQAELATLWDIVEEGSRLDPKSSQSLKTKTRRLDLEFADTYNARMAGALVRSLSNLKTLVFNYYPSFPTYFPLLPDSLIEAVVSVRPPGSGIEHIEFRSSYEPPSYSHLIRIAGRCHDLKYLHLEFVALMPGDFHLLRSPPTSIAFSQLRILSIGSANHRGYSLHTIRTNSLSQRGILQLISLFDQSPPKLPNLEQLHLFGDVCWLSPFIEKNGNQSHRFGFLLCVDGL
ncbi:hypothetical protein FA13DRAFT_1800638 [Coprinellus micaceus]|uniref:Uncharacterized protein n=1 Tax=Coprinellus micaceus TaxID=71717 RepID=A0A4Y7SHW3_COPMI|nr:hypothetical protein FA13DRAFT_1800638 [Coprinellus micaceus]